MITGNILGPGITEVLVVIQYFRISVQTTLSGAAKRVLGKIVKSCHLLQPKPQKTLQWVSQMGSSRSGITNFMSPFDLRGAWLWLDHQQHKMEEWVKRIKVLHRHDNANYRDFTPVLGHPVLSALGDWVPPKGGDSCIAPCDSSSLCQSLGVTTLLFDRQACSKNNHCWCHLWLPSDKSTSHSLACPEFHKPFLSFLL